MKAWISSLMVLCLCYQFVGVVRAAIPEYAELQAQSQTPDQDDASKGSKDIDQVVSYPIARVMPAIKQALATYGCDVKNEKPDSLECTRDRHVGLVVGSGGEKITVQLTAKGDDTRVVIKTGKGFVGRLGKKNWSTPIFGEAIKILKAS